MRLRLLIPVVGVVLTLFVLGCSSSSTGQTTEQASQRNEPPTGTIEFRDPNGLISIWMPPEWVETTEAFKRLTKNLAGDDASDTVVFAGGKPIPASDRHDPNIQVNSDAVPENTVLSSITDSFEIGSVDGNTQVKAKNPIRVSGYAGELIEIEASGTSIESRSVRLIYLLREDRLWVLQCTVQDESFEIDRCVEYMSTIEFN